MRLFRYMSQDRFIDFVLLFYITSIIASTSPTAKSQFSYLYDTFSVKYRKEIYF